jgi:hypothetical protein
MSAKYNNFRPGCEILEDRRQMSASPLLISASPVPPTLSSAAEMLTHSPESYANLVTSAYQHYLGRTPAAAEVTVWVNALTGGWTNQQMEAGFVASQEYLTKYGGPGADWVKAVYKDLLTRTPSDQEVNALVDALKSGVSPIQIAEAVASSSERGSERIVEDYNHLFNRPASKEEATAWADLAAQQGLTNQDVVAQLLSSDEYLEAHGQAYMQQHNYPKLPSGYRIVNDGLFHPGSADGYLQDHGSSAVDWLYGVYPDVIGRTPDVPGLNAWLQALASSYHASQQQ